MINSALPDEYRDLARYQAQIESALFQLPNVVGVAIGRISQGGVRSKEAGISVFVERKLPADRLLNNERIDKVLPRKNAKYRLDVVETGRIAANGTPLLSINARPAMGGFSIGHYAGLAGTGTLGTCCYDATAFPGMPTRTYLLSNNHVIAANNLAKTGDAILQPSLFDGGVYPKDVIARLSRYVAIQFHAGASKPCNVVDAAIAEGDLQDLDREIYWIGYLKRLVAPANIGSPVQKTGRTTGFTTGVISNLNATIDVDYPGGLTARFCGQIGATYMSSGGDSGSIVATGKGEALGLLFADSLLQSHTFMNPIAAVESELGIRVTE